MASIINSITEGNKTNMDSRTNVELNGQSFKTFKFKTESLNPNSTTIVYSKNIGGDIGIYGNAIFGIYGTSKYGSVANQSFVLGNNILGTSTLGERSSDLEIVRVIPENNIFKENLLSDIFINTGETTATIVVGSVTF